MRGLSVSAIRFAESILAGAVVGVAAELLLGPYGWLAGLAPVLCSPAVGGLDLAGKLFYSAAVVRENRARRVFAWRLHCLACMFLTDRGAAYEAMARVAETNGQREKLVALIRRREKKSRGRHSLLLVETYLAMGQTSRAVACLKAPGSTRGLEEAMLLSEIAVSQGRGEEALATLSEASPPSCPDGRFLSLRAKALRLAGRPAEALSDIEEAVKQRPAFAAFRLQKALVLNDLGRIGEAIGCCDKAILIQPSFPEAWHVKGVLYARRGSLRAAVRSLSRAVDYDGADSAAFALREELLSWRRTGTRRALAKSPLIMVRTDTESFTLAVGGKRRVTVKVQSETDAGNVVLAVLEPYGGGIEAEASRIFLGKIRAGETKSCSFQVTARRASSVNLGNPWAVNLVAVGEGLWADAAVLFHVEDPEEGRVFLVLTEDQEVAIRRERMGAGENGRFRVEEARLDLIAKSERAERIAERFGFAWTHMLDVGTALGMVKWAARSSPSWAALSEELARHYSGSLARGHDIQLHLHLSAVPDSYFFCYSMNHDPRTVVFDLQKKNRYFPGWQVNSWANVVPRLGSARDIDSRRGSLMWAKRSLEEAVVPARFDWSPILFRAGQWDFGKSLAEREKSVLALAESGILADSSATGGRSVHDRLFGFGAPVDRAVYFSRGGDVDARARDLSERGIVEMLPLIMPQGKHPVSPRDPPRHVLAAYRALLNKGRVKSGCHIITEMEHVVTIGGIGDAEGGRAWRRVERHFRTLARRAPKLAAAGASEALASWLDYNSPEPIGLLSETDLSKTASPGTCRRAFAVRFLAGALIRERPRRLTVSLVVPAFDRLRIREARIVADGRTKWRASRVAPGRLTVRMTVSEKDRERHLLILDLENQQR